MLSLLIREDRHAIKKEYLLRFFLVLIFFLTSLLIVFGVVIFSFYIQVDFESEIAKKQLEDIRNSSDIQSLNQMNSLNENIENKVDQFNILDFNQSDLVEKILSKNREGIGLNLINIDLDYSDEGAFASIELSGISKTRNDLVSYQNNLMESDVFEKVDVPFSSFVQNSDIPFTINIKTVELNNYFINEN